MNEHYKVIHLDDEGNIRKIFIFKNDTSRIPSSFEELVEDVSERVNDEDIKASIGDTNYKLLDKEKIGRKEQQIYLVKMNIYLDDTIEIIKRKLSIVFKKFISTKEMYLFGKNSLRISNDLIFDIASNNNKDEITRYKLITTLNNLGINKELSKETYTFSDIIDLDLTDNTNSLLPLGINYIEHKQTPINYNPFNTQTINDKISDSEKQLVSTQNNTTLAKYGSLVDNTIYLCSYADIITFGERNSLLIKTLTKLYFPFLFNLDIFSKKTFNDKKMELQKIINDEINDEFYKYIQSIQLLNEMYKSNKNAITYLKDKDGKAKKGIKYINCSVIQKRTTNIPLEVIFKIINTSELIPLIKYNPGRMQENIFRLYTNKEAVNGKKIPLLNQQTILKINNLFNTKKTILFLFKDKEYDFARGKIHEYVICELHSSGTIEIFINSIKLLTKDEISRIILEKINPILKTIENILLQHGYNFDLFKSFDDDNIKITRMEYNSNVLLIKPTLELTQNIGCLSSIVNIIDSNITPEAKLRFKRVSNFNKMNSVTAFITDKIPYKLSKKR